MARKPRLLKTDIEGVYVNDNGVHVDAHGVALAFMELRAKDRAQRREVLDHDVTEPHHLLKALSMDPRLPLHFRAEMAKSAAPYFAAKKLDRGTGDDGVTAEDYAARVREALEQADASVGKKLAVERDAKAQRGAAK